MVKVSKIVENREETERQLLQNLYKIDRNLKRNSSKTMLDEFTQSFS